MRQTPNYGGRVFKRQKEGSFVVESTCIKKILRNFELSGLRYQKKHLAKVVKCSTIELMDLGVHKKKLNHGGRVQKNWGTFGVKGTFTTTTIGSIKTPDSLSSTKTNIWLGWLSSELARGVAWKGSWTLNFWVFLLQQHKHATMVAKCFPRGGNGYDQMPTVKFSRAWKPLKAWIFCF